MRILPASAGSDPADRSMAVDLLVREEPDEEEEEEEEEEDDGESEDDGDSDGYSE